MAREPLEVLHLARLHQLPEEDRIHTVDPKDDDPRLRGRSSARLAAREKCQAERPDKKQSEKWKDHAVIIEPQERMSAPRDAPNSEQLFNLGLLEKSLSLHTWWNLDAKEVQHRGRHISEARVALPGRQV